MTERRLPIIRVPLFKRGAEVMYNSRIYVIDHVTVTSKGMMVHLEGVEGSVPEEHLSIEWTELDLEEIRKNGFKGN